MKTRFLFALCLYFFPTIVWANPDIIWKGDALWKVWSMYREYSLADGSREYRTDQYFLGKDTTIGTNAYRPVFWREDSDAKNEVSAGYALREDSVRVYVYDYTSQKEYVLFDFSLTENDVLAMDWMEETETCKNPVFRILAVGDTIIPTSIWQERLHYLKVYDSVHQVTDMWLSEVGSASHGIVWHRDFGRSLDTIETVLCVNEGQIYSNSEYETCYISMDESFHVSERGKLTYIATPGVFDMPLDCCHHVLAAELGKSVYIIKYKTTISNYKDWTYDFLPFLFQGVEYMEGDSVEVEGYVSMCYDLGGRLYSELKLENIWKIGTALIDRQQKAKLKLTPNPANETITISASGCNLWRMEILDANGRVLYATTLNGADSFRYNVSWMPSGVYLVRVETSCVVLTEKFSVE